jgi:hypothetical protein
LKKYPTSAFSKSIWQEIDFDFMREPVPCLPLGTSGDGLIPIGIEATKRGVEISGTIWFLPSASYDLSLCLARPSFSSIESVSVSKLRRAVITDSHLENHSLKITLEDSLALSGPTFQDAD